MDNLLTASIKFITYPLITFPNFGNCFIYKPILNFARLKRLLAFSKFQKKTDQMLDTIDEQAQKKVSFLKIAGLFY
jgi:hypothetical protein